jgi:hypothetical protein
MLTQEKPTIHLEIQPTNIIKEIEAKLTLEQNEKLYSIYVNILLKLQCEYSRAKLNLHLCRGLPEIESEIATYN